MLDPLTAISLASSIAQFVDFGLKLCTLTKSIYHAGSSDGNVDMQLITGDVIRASERLSADLQIPSATGCNSKDDEELLKLVNECLKIGNDLQSRLVDLHLDGHRGKWKSVRQAMKTIWNREKLDDLATRLNAFKAQLQFHIIISLKQASEDDILQRNYRLAALEEGDRNIIAAIDQQSIAILTRLHHTGEKQSEFRRNVLGALQALRDNQLLPERSSHDKARQTVLSTLYFRHQSLRFDQVGANHPKTCEWIFRCSVNNNNLQTYFVDWLESGAGCFWVTGKAGSPVDVGKPALSHCSNIFLLERWNAGTPDQKSQKGLLRALLYQILKGRPDLTELLLPGLFQATLAGQPDALDLAESELQKAFEILAELTKTSSKDPDFIPLKICLFVDGIDEFEGDAAVIAKLFRKISTGTGIKILVSGRPLNACQIAFADCPQIKVQDLTYDDIKRYVHDHFNEDEPLQALAINDALAMKGLVEEIIDKADGVFLWVILVVASLLNQIEGADDIEDLQKTLDELPEDLEKLYDHIFASLDKRYRCSASQYFAIVRYYAEVYPEVPLTTLMLSYMDTGTLETLLNTPHGFFNEEASYRRCEIMETRIRRRCLGLLEVHHWKAPADHASTSTPLLYSTIHYLHKSLTEFLYQDKYWGPIQEQSGLSPSDLEQRLCRAHVYHQKQYLWWHAIPESRHRDFDKIAPVSIADYERSTQAPRTILWNPAHSLLKLIRRIESQRPVAEPKAIEEMIRIITRSCHTTDQYKSQAIFRDPGTDARQRSKDSILNFAIQAGFVTVAEERLAAKQSFETSPFHMLIDSYLLEESWEAPPSTYLPICKALIAAGGRPSDPSGKAAWLRIVRKFMECEALGQNQPFKFKGNGGAVSDVLDDVVMLFIEHGADLAVPINRKSRAWDILPPRLKRRVPKHLVPEENEIQNDWIFVTVDANMKRDDIIAEQALQGAVTASDIATTLMALGHTAVDVALRGAEFVADKIREEMNSQGI